MLKSCTFDEAAIEAPLLQKKRNHYCFLNGHHIIHNFISWLWFLTRNMICNEKEMRPSLCLKMQPRFVLLLSLMPAHVEHVCMYLMIGKGQIAQKRPSCGENRVKNTIYE